VAARADENAERLAYGEHLSAECTACHRIDGSDDGIPSIIGWAVPTFIAVLKSYRDGERTNPVMVLVATSLEEDQMAALAAYFGSLGATKR
jgi:cytochrome c